MSTMRSQRGEGKAGCVFWILLLVVGGLVAWRWIPVTIADMQLKDHMDELAKLYPRKDARFFERSIHDRAKELRISIDQKKIRVEKNQRRVIMEVEYTVPLDFFVFTYQKNYNHRMERDIYLM